MKKVLLLKITKTLCYTRPNLTNLSRALCSMSSGPQSEKLPSGKSHSGKRWGANGQFTLNSDCSFRNASALGAPTCLSGDCCRRCGASTPSWSGGPRPSSRPGSSSSATSSANTSSRGSTLISPISRSHRLLIIVKCRQSIKYQFYSNVQHQRKIGCSWRLKYLPTTYKVMEPLCLRNIVARYKTPTNEK